MENSEYIIGFIIQIVVIVITIVITNWFSLRKHTITKFFDRKLEYLEIIYEKVITFEESLHKYILFAGAETQDKYLEEKVKEFSKLEKSFFSLQKYYKRKEIAFDDKSVSVLKSFLGESLLIMSNLKSSIRSQRTGDHEASLKKWDEALSRLQVDFKKVKDELRDTFIMSAN